VISGSRVSPPQDWERSRGCAPERVRCCHSVKRCRDPEWPTARRQATGSKLATRLFWICSGRMRTPAHPLPAEWTPAILLAAAHLDPRAPAATKYGPGRLKLGAVRHPDYHRESPLPLPPSSSRACCRGPTSTEQEREASPLSSGLLSLLLLNPPSRPHLVPPFRSSLPDFSREILP